MDPVRPSAPHASISVARWVAAALLALLAALALSGCERGAAAPGATLDLELVKSGAGPDALRYTLRAVGEGAAAADATYRFECLRRDDGSSLLTLADASGAELARALRQPGGRTELTTASGLHATSDAGSVEVGSAQRSHLALAEWLLFDADVFSHYPMPAGAAPDLEGWRDGLDLVDSAAPAQATDLAAQRACITFESFGIEVTVCVPTP